MDAYKVPEIAHKIKPVDYDFGAVRLEVLTSLLGVSFR